MSKKSKELSPWLSPSELGFRVREFFAGFGTSIRLLLRVIITPCAFRPLVKQLYVLGNRSLSIIVLCGLFVGFVLALQMYNIIERFGAGNMVGMVTAFAMLRELGPALTAILYAGRAGTSLTAEIGLMKSNDELTAMEMMAVDPVREVLAPRFWAGVIAVPLLTAIFISIGIIGAYLVCVPLIGMDGSVFWSLMQNSIDVFHDVG
ncbi:MAG: ABC transporter permease, partial [Saezia sp.]